MRAGGGVMTQEQQPAGAIPFLRGSEEQAIKLRRHVTEVYDNVALVRDVVTVCLELGRVHHGGTFNCEIAHVLRRCVTDRLYFQMRALAGLAERLGGKTGFSEEAQAAGGVQ